MAFTNIIDIIYPIGSMYFSNTSTSPATLFGGTWAQIKNALISSLGYGSNTLGNYGNSNTITVEQMPNHTHSVHFSLTGTNLTLPNNTGNWYVIDSQWSWVVSSSPITYTGGGNPFYPYNYCANVWVRTA